jgi:tripartite-type tricarboxylate transporter receptor subunit TctC
MEQLADMTKGRLLHVPYKGAAPAITDVLGGHVDGFFGDIPGLIGNIKSGKLKALGIAAPKRSAALPEVKTFAEMGVPGVDSNNWYALFVKAGTSKAEIERINMAIKKVLAQDDIKTRLLQSGTEPVGSSPDELANVLKSDINKWTKLIKAKNIKPE